jgi:3-hydroxyacyl-[acyl-carrier-protein] dehydratase
MWIDRIVEHEPGVRLVAVKNVSLAEPHLQDHFPDNPIMPAALIIEGVAQTSGIMVGAINKFQEKVLLAKITKVEFTLDARPGDTLRYTATLDRIDDAGAATTAQVHLRCNEDGADWQVIGEVNLMFSHADQNMSGLDLPEENFVFGDNFRAILSASGLRPETV